MKKLLTLIILLVVVVGAAAAVLFFMKDGFVKAKIQKDLEMLLGMPVQVGEMQIDMNEGKVLIDFIQVKNPEGYTQEVFANIGNVDMACDVKKIFFKSQYDCSKVTLDLNEVYIERRLDGKVNLSELNAVNSPDLDIREDSATRRSSGFYVERFEMTLKKATLYEQVKGQPLRKLDAGFKGRKEVYGYVTNPNTLIYIPMVKVLFNLKRGSLGLPRTKMQQKIMATTGKL